jgi:hypothetical protein
VESSVPLLIRLHLSPCRYSWVPIFQLIFVIHSLTFPSHHLSL